MPLKTNTIQRVFNYNGRPLPDPNPVMTPEAVKSHYANVYPELNTALVEEGEIAGGQKVWNFKIKIGNNG